MNYNEFRNLPEIQKRDREPGDIGITIHEGQHIANDINLGKTRQEIRSSLAEILPGLDANTLDELTNEALRKQLDKDQLKDFAEKAKSGGLKLESMDTSAISKEEPQKGFVEKVNTPTATISSPKTQPSTGTVTKDDEVR